MSRHNKPFTLSVIAIFAAICASSSGGNDPSGWNKDRAGQYLDTRAQAWFDFSSAERGQGVTRTSCVCCHTVLPYALSRPVLRRMTAAGLPTESERKLIEHTKKRVDGWANLDSPAFQLLYDFNEQKKKESWGTEAVLNAVILAFADRYAGRNSPDDATKKAFVNLWRTQSADGLQKGSWEWLDFKLEPWESGNARYFGAALAAIAVGTSPGYYSRGVDSGVDAKVDLLRSFLRQGAGGPNLHDRAWTLWAASTLDGTLSSDERKAIVAELFAKQRDDGGWSLSSLGAYTRIDKTPQEIASDGYATGLLLHVLQVAGVSAEDSKLSKGLRWLRANQSETGDWRVKSVNKNRNPESHVGRFMSDAATAMAVLALGH